MSNLNDVLLGIESTLDTLESEVRRIAAAKKSRRKKTAGMSRTAGEVRFVKDRSDGTNWAWDDFRHSAERTIPQGFKFNPKNMKILLRLLRSTAMALGHTMSAYTQLAKSKSIDFSIDGKIGGTGYVKKISGIRQEYSNVIEVLSSLTDSINDEISAPHWQRSLEGSDSETRQEVNELLEDVEQIRYSPEDFARQQELEQDEEDHKKQEKDSPKSGS